MRFNNHLFRMIVLIRESKERMMTDLLENDFSMLCYL